MWFLLAPLSLCGAAWLIFPPGIRSSPSHSLCYFYLHVPEPSQGLPQFLSRIYLDNQPIARYDSLTRKMEPLVSWMEELQKEDPNYWKNETEALQATEEKFRAHLESVQTLYPQIEGLQSTQKTLGCELREDGSQGGYLNYAYGGMDFSFEMETLTWVTAQPQAEKMQENWHPEWSPENKVDLEETCIRRLQRYLSYGKEALQKKGRNWFVWGGPLFVVLLVLLTIFLLGWWWKSRGNLHPGGTSFSDPVSSERLTSVEIEIQEMHRPGAAPEARQAQKANSPFQDRDGCTSAGAQFPGKHQQHQLQPR